MNKQQREQKIALLERELAMLHSRAPACAICEHYLGNSQCRHWSATVPAEVLPEGCEAWVDDGVPF